MASQADIKKVGIWIRVSTEFQVKGDSPEHHEAKARYYAEAKGWNVVEVYRLDATSGKSVMPLATTQRMLADVRSGKITGLIFSNLSRLARNTSELLEFADIFKAHDADLISLSDSIDTSTPAGRFFYTIMSAFVTLEREVTSERVKASVPVRARLNKPLGGQAPFGYRWNDGTLEPDPDEAPVRALLYDLFLEHKRKKTVARVLNELGLRTRSGVAFSDTTIDRLLRDPTAKGTRRANYCRSTGDKKKWELKPEEDWVLLPCPAIVSEEKWNACNAILDAQRASDVRQPRKAVFLFAGLLYCHCGPDSKMYVPSNTHKYTCRACFHKIEVQELEEIFLARYREFFSAPAEVAAYFDDAKNVISEKEALHAKLQAELTRLQSEIDRTHRAFIDEHLDSATLGRIMRPLSERCTQLEREIPELQAEIDFIKIQSLSTAQVMEEAPTLHALWPNFAHDHKRQIIEGLTDRVVVYADEVKFIIKGLPDLRPVGQPEGATTEQTISRGSCWR